jgi:hypothetical protein
MTEVELARQLVKEIEAENREFILLKSELRADYERLIRNSQRHLEESYALLARTNAALGHR